MVFLSKIRVLLLCIVLSSNFLAFSQEDEDVKDDNQETGYILKPSIYVGMGVLSYIGDLNYSNNDLFAEFRKGYNFCVTKRFNTYVGGEFDFMSGVLSYNETNAETFLNFYTPFKSFSLNLRAYLDNHVLKSFPNEVSVFGSAGIGGISFNPKGDLLDSKGNPYNFEAYNPGIRDYVFETELTDSVEKYDEFSLFFPVKLGLTIHFSKYFEFDMSMSYNITMTDYIDNTKKEDHDANDSYLFASFGFRYNIMKRTKAQVEIDMELEQNLSVEEKRDSDGDGITDFDDECAETPKGIFVDENGCPKDDDKDGVPDYMDKEPNTPNIKDTSVVVDVYGVQIKDDSYTSDYDSVFMAMKRENVTDESLYSSNDSETVELPNYEELIAPGTNFVPEMYREADFNQDGYISPDEIVEVIDLFFMGQTEQFNTIKKINDLIDYFFDQ